MQEDNNVTYIGYDGGKVVDGFKGLVVVVTTHEALDVGRAGACHIGAVHQVHLNNYLSN